MSRAIWHLPRLNSFADAVRHYEDTTPIRGRGQRRPLGRRHDHEAFWMHKADDGSIQCVAYKTPIVTFHPDNTVTVQNGGHVTNTTHNAIQQILYARGVEVSGWRSRTKLLVNGHVHLLGNDEKLKLCLGEDGKLQLPAKQQLVGYSMDRKAANNVKRRYKEFSDYLVGLVRLRTQTVKNDRPYHPYEHDALVLTGQEIADTLGLVKTTADYMRPAINFSHLTMEYGRNWYAREARTIRPAQEVAFLSLINPGQPEETKLRNYYTAAVALIVGDSVPVFTEDYDQSATVTRAPSGVIERYARALMMANAKEVLVLTKLPPGKMPNPKYRGWVLDSEDFIYEGEME